MTHRLSVALLTVILIGLYACKNNDEVFPKMTYTDLTVVNASPNILNFYLNGTRQNNSASLFPGAFVTHMPLAAGLQNYSFKIAGTAPILFSDPLNLNAQTYYSLYVTGNTVNDAFFHADTLYSDTSKNMATIRFVNASPDIGAVDVYVDSASFKARAFKSTSVFLTIGSGRKEVKIFQSGASTPKVDTVISISPNQTYTLFSKGLLNGTGYATFDLGILTN